MQHFFVTCVVLTLASACHLSQPLATANDAKPLSATFTCGMNGPARTDEHFLSGETVFMTVSAPGYPIPKGGLCQFSARYSVVNKEGKALFTTADDKLNAQFEIGASSVKFLLRCELTTTLKPGAYEFVTELRDKKSREIYRNRQSITILPPDTFTLCQFCFAANREGTAPLGATFETCQQVYLTWVIYNPQAQDGKWNVATSIRVLDNKGQPIAPPREPQKQSTPVTEVNVINSQVAITLENPGDFTAEVTVKDLASGKTGVCSIPFRVVASLADIIPAPTQ